jgi:dTDP-4-dehydrorhamnose reductase
MLIQEPIEIWGGIEATINRVGNDYIDQSEFSGHYSRANDVDLIASLGIKMLRYPVLWEKHQPQKDTAIDWTFVEKNLVRLKELNVEPIAGLVHHGSGPLHVNFFDGSFETGVADYAKLVAEKFPWLEYYTPINEPLTTARFCGLYGHWFPHEKSAYSFYKILLSECKATVMAMQAIREINPDAKLIQTEDIGKVYSTSLLQYQADFENERRWLSYDLLTGTLTPDKQMWNFLLGVGIKRHELEYFLKNHCKPHIAGFNYYITSERYLDENLPRYPEHVHGGNGRHQYADVEVVRVPYLNETGPAVLLQEAWERYQLPLAVTECHLHCTREEQMRWFNEMWQTVNLLKTQGVDIRALTAWAIFGTYGWNTLVTKPWGEYESGVFNLSSGKPRPTAIARLIQTLAKEQVSDHPVLKTAGWWKQEKRIAYPDHRVFQIKKQNTVSKEKPLLIVGKSEMVGSGYNQICQDRNIHHVWLNQIDLNNPDQNITEQLIEEFKPWAIIYADDIVKPDHSAIHLKNNFNQTAKTSLLLAELCEKHSVKLVVFSNESVFNGNKKTPYIESDLLAPIDESGKRIAQAEKEILNKNPEALIIRTGNFFSPWNHNSFVADTLTKLKEGRQVIVKQNRLVSPAYIPDLVHASLNMLLDNESGISHVANNGPVTYADFARKIAQMSGLDFRLIKEVFENKLPQQETAVYNTAMQSEKGIQLPALESALKHYLDVTNNVYQPEKIAV